MTTMKHTISLLVSNKPGVLTRITLIFARRGFNIDTLVVSQGRQSGFSRMNIEATGNARTLHLMLTQLNRLIDVIHAVEHSGEDTVQRELALFKIQCTANQRTEVLQIAETFRGQTVDIGDETITLQVVGKTSKVDAFSKMMTPFGIKELVRTGKVLMSRGAEATA